MLNKSNSSTMKKAFGAPISREVATTLIQRMLALKEKIQERWSTASVATQANDELDTAVINSPINGFVFDRYLVERFFTNPEYKEMRYLVVLNGVNENQPTAILAACAQVSDINKLSDEGIESQNNILEVLGDGDIALVQHPHGTGVTTINAPLRFFKDNNVNSSDLFLEIM